MNADRTSLGRGHASTDEEGVEVGRRVRLPRGSRRPIRVYINGIRQTEGVDYTLDGEWVHFERPIVKEGKLSGWRWLSMWIGLFGTYRKHETVDVEYTIGTTTHLASDLAVQPDPDV
jgi:hypothetical protein